MNILKKKYLFLIISLLLGGGLLFYYWFNPQSESYLLKCPFKFFTGYDCPGCGSQRALHATLHGQFREAFSYNPLFIIALPYVLTGILFEWFGLKYSYPKTRKILFGSTAIYTVTGIIILFFIIRNL
ncbi:DUF2752 domain-containing protein [Chryseobacterium sp. SNU WT5]|uniref:DUF2752 domain-containing protein n=1 Tax=Chryseobacterium sp. SNU WT5 TaxID=2594269 RepID=UPI00117BF3AF|nr:DUF2752 domain-containing protein [Chryseobacterium sp. SNU WT5]QDP85053.1 DUF2752 domain-containing protein [Chryseobacterium sp. SNU WT5]